MVEVMRFAFTLDTIGRGKTTLIIPLRGNPGCCTVGDLLKLFTRRLNKKFGTDNSVGSVLRLTLDNGDVLEPGVNEEDVIDCFWRGSGTHKILIEMEGSVILPSPPTPVSAPRAFLPSIHGRGVPAVGEGEIPPTNVVKNMSATEDDADRKKRRWRDLTPRSGNQGHQGPKQLITSPKTMQPSPPPRRSDRQDEAAALDDRRHRSSIPTADVTSDKKQHGISAETDATGATTTATNRVPGKSRNSIQNIIEGERVKKSTYTDTERKGSARNRHKSDGLSCYKRSPAPEPPIGRNNRVYTDPRTQPLSPACHPPENVPNPRVGIVEFANCDEENNKKHRNDIPVVGDSDEISNDEQNCLKFMSSEICSPRTDDMMSLFRNDVLISEDVRKWFELLSDELLFDEQCDRALIMEDETRCVRVVEFGWSLHDNCDTSDKEIPQFTNWVLNGNSIYSEINSAKITNTTTETEQQSISESVREVESHRQSNKIYTTNNISNSSPIHSKVDSLKITNTTTERVTTPIPDCEVAGDVKSYQLYQNHDMSVADGSTLWPLVDNLIHNSDSGVVHNQNNSNSCELYSNIYDYNEKGIVSVREVCKEETTNSDDIDEEEFVFVEEIKERQTTTSPTAIPTGNEGFVSVKQVCCEHTIQLDRYNISEMLIDEEGTRLLISQIQSTENDAIHSIQTRETIDVNNSLIVKEHEEMIRESLIDSEKREFLSLKILHKEALNILHSNDIKNNINDLLRKEQLIRNDISSSALNELNITTHECLDPIVKYSKEYSIKVFSIEECQHSDYKLLYAAERKSYLKLTDQISDGFMRIVIQQELKYESDFRKFKNECSNTSDSLISMEERKRLMFQRAFQDGITRIGCQHNGYLLSTKGRVSTPAPLSFVAKTTPLTSPDVCYTRSSILSPPITASVCQKDFSCELLTRLSTPACDFVKLSSTGSSKRASTSSSGSKFASSSPQRLSTAPHATTGSLIPLALKPKQLMSSPSLSGVQETKFSSGVSTVFSPSSVSSLGLSPNTVAAVRDFTTETTTVPTPALTCSEFASFRMETPSSPDFPSVVSSGSPERASQFMMSPVTSLVDFPKVNMTRLETPLVDSFDDEFDNCQTSVSPQLRVSLKHSNDLSDRPGTSSLKKNVSFRSPIRSICSCSDTSSNFDLHEMPCNCEPID